MTFAQHNGRPDVGLVVQEEIAVKRMIAPVLGFAVAALIGSSANAGVYFATDAAGLPISLDSSSTTISATPIASTGPVTDVTISIDFAKCDDPSIIGAGPRCIGQGFSFDREIVFTLFNPGGTAVSLVTQDTYSGSTPGAGRVTVTFQDGAAALGGGVTAGTFAPVGSLSDFIGLSGTGVWQLFAQDTVGSDRLDVFAFCLRVVTDDNGSGGSDCRIAQVSEPTSAPLLGVALLGLMGLAHRRFRPQA